MPNCPIAWAVNFYPDELCLKTRFADMQRGIREFVILNKRRKLNSILQIRTIERALTLTCAGKKVAVGRIARQLLFYTSQIADIRPWVTPPPGPAANPIH